DDSICVLNGGSLSYPARVELGFASKYNAGVSDSLRLFTESSSRRGRDISNMFDKYNTDNSIHVLNDGYLSSSARVELGVTSKYLKADNIGLRSLMGIDIPISTRGETGLLADYGMRVNDSLYVLKDYSGVSLEIGNKYSSINSIALEIENNDYMTRNNFGINSIINTSLTMEASAELAMSGKYSANTIFGTQLLTNRYNLNDYSSIENNIYSDTRIDIIMPTKQVAPSKTLKAVRHILEQHKTNFDNSHYGCTYEEQETEKEINITINYYFNGDLISTNMHIGSNIINKKLN
ncbi:MAG: hypothetical protein ACXWE7_13285, partial [Nitrososphaeraceae archaeon]